MTFREICHGRPLLQAWSIQNLNTIPNNCVWRILYSSVFMVLAFGARGHLFEPYISTMYSFICFFVTDFVRTKDSRHIVENLDNAV